MTEQYTPTTEEVRELVAEAREWASSYASWGDNGLVDRLVDALEATLGEPTEPESGKVRQERAKLVAVRDILNRDDFGDEWGHDEWVYLQAAEAKLADIEEALGSVMLAEPDDATAELEAQLANAKAGWESALRIVNEGNEIIKRVGAERDVARAEIESRIDDRDYWYGIANISKSQRDAATEPSEETLADHVEAIKKYLRENELSDMTRRAFVADLYDVLREVGERV